MNLVIASYEATKSGSVLMKAYDDSLVSEADLTICKFLANYLLDVYVLKHGQFFSNEAYS